MDILDYLRALRRRWRVIVVVTLVASFAAFLTAPEQPEGTGAPVGTRYTATTTLLRSPDVQQTDLSLIRLYVSTGEIPRRVAEVLDWPGVPAELSARISVGGDNEVGTITIGTTAPARAEAERIANTFAEETIAYLGESAEESQQRAITVTNETVNSVTSQLAEIDRKIEAEVEGEGNTRRSILEAQKNALLAQLQGLYGRLGELTAAPASAPLNVLERAEAYPQVTGSPSLQAPTGRAPRLLLGLLVGLALGGAAALVIERLDTRLQGRDGAEAAFGLPVVAEIPHMSRKLRASGPVVTASVPESAAAEAFRSLRAAMLLMPSKVLLGEGDDQRRREAGGQVVLVTAPTAGSGKSTTAVNLAVAIAESGRRVLVVDADFRNPAVNRMLDVGTQVGLTDLAMMGDVGRLDKVIQQSRVAPLQVLPAGSRTVPGNTIEAALPTLIGQARRLADVVVIDAAPLLSGSDALDVLPHVDTVIMVGRLRRTTHEQAQRARELLARIAVPVLGVALVGTRTTPAAPSGSSGLADRIGAFRPGSTRRQPKHDRNMRHSNVAD